MWVCLTDDAVDSRHSSRNPCNHRLHSVARNEWQMRILYCRCVSSGKGNTRVFREGTSVHSLSSEASMSKMALAGRQ